MIEIQLTPLVLPYLFSAILTLALTLYAVEQVRRNGWDDTTVAFIGIVLGTTIWSVARGFEFLFVSETLTRFWIAVLYVGYGSATLSALFFALAFTGRKRFLKKRYVTAVLLIPAVAVIVAGTNSYHELFWTGEFILYDDVYGETVVFSRTFEPLFHAYLMYTVGATLLGVGLLLRMSIGSPNVYRQQTIAFALGAFIALAFGLLFALEAQPVVPTFVDLTPVGFAITGLCFGYAIFRHKLLDLVPVARDTVIDSMRDGYVVLDAEDRIVDLNEAARDFLAVEETAIGGRLAAHLPESEAILADHEPGTRTEREIETTVNGQQRFIVVSISALSQDDTDIGRLVLLRDVTERRSVQRRYQALIENSSDLILVTDPDGAITYASPSLETIAGVDPGAVVGENAFDFVHEDDREGFRETVDELLDQPGEKTRYEYRTFDSGGETLYLEASVWNLLENPFVGGIVVNAREITERKRREQELEEANKQLTRANEQLEQFASVISHDLRNPINVAKGHVDIAEKTGREESFEKIEDSLERMEAIIDDVLTLARQGDSIGETEAVDVQERAETAWEHVATDDATLVVEENGRFQADGDRLLQLLENLFRNAHEHGGDDVTVGVGIDNGTFFVEDDGPGIPAEDREDVLESGYTTNEDGTGFGLSIVEQIASAHGWEVSIADGTRGGARFEFSGIERQG